MGQGKLIFISMIVAAVISVPAWSANLSAAQRPHIDQLLPDEDALPADISSMHAASIRVLKSEHRMDILDSHGQIIRSYKVSLGYSPGQKTREGDGRTPEGVYYIDGHNERSNYYRSLHISYPSKADIARARRAGISKVGGSIFIHGKPNDKTPLWWRRVQDSDWTNGCIAVSDKDIAELWNLVEDGTPIIIKP